MSTPDPSVEPQPDPNAPTVEAPVNVVAPGSAPDAPPLPDLSVGDGSDTPPADAPVATEVGATPAPGSVAPDPAVDSAQAVTSQGATLDPGTPLVPGDTIVAADASAPTDSASAAPADNPVDPGGAPMGQPVDNPANSGADTGSDFPTFKAGTPNTQPVNPNDPGNVAPTDVVPADAPVLGTQATDPTTGEPLTTASGAAILPLPDGTTTPDHVDPADTQPVVPTITAHVDPSGAAGLVIEKQNQPPAEDPPPSRSEVNAQAVLDQGTLTPGAAGSAIHPVETLDSHTVDPSGTADDSQPGAAPQPHLSETDTALDTNNHPGESTDAQTATFDTRINPSDRGAKGQTSMPPELGEELITSSVKALAENGFHADLVHQWVDQAFADLQGQRSSAQTRGDADPYPQLSI